MDNSVTGVANHSWCKERRVEYILTSFVTHGLIKFVPKPNRMKIYPEARIERRFITEFVGFSAGRDKSRIREAACTAVRQEHGVTAIAIQKLKPEN